MSLLSTLLSFYYFRRAWQWLCCFISHPYKLTSLCWIEINMDYYFLVLLLLSVFVIILLIYHWTIVHLSWTTLEGLWSNNKYLNDHPLSFIIFKWNDSTFCYSYIIAIACLDSFCSCIFPPKTIISCSVNLWNESSLNSAAPQKSQVSAQMRVSHPQHEVSSHVLNEGVIKIHQRQHGLRRPQPRTSGQRRRDGPHWIRKMKGQGVCCLPESCCVASSQHPWTSSIWRNLRGSVKEH